MEQQHAQPEKRPRRPKKRKRHIFRKIAFSLFSLLLIGLITVGMLAWLFMSYVQTTLAPTLQVNADDYTMSLSSIIYYQDNDTDEWVELQKLYGTENRIWVDIEEMPDYMWQSVVAIEDERFFTHNGVDWKRTAGATVNMFISMSDTFGGSTITQQLLKNMTGDNDGTVNRKVREIFRALEFEKNYTKFEILELYLNTVYFGNNCYGVQTAAQFYFGKDVSELTAAECASIISITNNPSMYSPIRTLADNTGSVIGYELNETNVVRNKSRQELVLKNMWDPETGLCYLTDEEYEAAKNQELMFLEDVRSVEEVVAEAMEDASEDAVEASVEVIVGDTVLSTTTTEGKYNSYFIDEVFRNVRDDLAEAKGISADAATTLLYNGGYNIYTTMDLEIQCIAESVYEDRSNLDVTSYSGQQLQSGITIIDPYTGDVVAHVGGIGEKEGNLTWNYGAGTRQVGSSIKPLTVYSAALESGAVTPASVFDDYPVRELNGSYWPKNSPTTYKGMTTLSNGIINSINTIAVQVVEQNGLLNAYTFATENLKLGLVPADMAVSPLAMGGLTYGLSTIEMAAAYASFTNQGIYNEPRFYTLVTDSEGNVILDNTTESSVAMKETTAYFINTMLTNAVSYGTGTSAKFSGMTIAGKTGTTSENYDRYFVGYTPYYTAAVWTGYDSNEKITYSGNPAITMWKLIMEEIHQDLENTSFFKPDSGLESVTICVDSGLLATEACALDLRGSRVQSVTVAAGTAPTEYCDCHVAVQYCTVSNTLVGYTAPEKVQATDEFGVIIPDLWVETGNTIVLGANCSSDTIATASLLDITRVDYGSGVVAQDNEYLLSTWIARGDCTICQSVADTGDTGVDLDGDGQPDIDIDYSSDGDLSGLTQEERDALLAQNAADNDNDEEEGDDTAVSTEDPTGGFGDASINLWNEIWG
ncbi:transglycosylase domain-containing protein [Bengtsoniella intestinalis]|uniref:transglycosylase domain-containing protein n=1 Tax=Bengtsoniella intestinalis TaxID=3073143 RepID=UPI00391EF846